MCLARELAVNLSKHENKDGTPWGLTARRSPLGISRTAVVRMAARNSGPSRVNAYGRIQEVG